MKKKCQQFNGLSIFIPVPETSKSDSPYLLPALGSVRLNYLSDFDRFKRVSPIFFSAYSPHLSSFTDGSNSCFINKGKASAKFK